MKTSVLLFVVGVSLTLLLAEGLGIVAGVFVTALLSGGLGFTLREFQRLSMEGETRNHAAGRILDFRNAGFQTTFRHLSPKKQFLESAAYRHGKATSELR